MVWRIILNVGQFTPYRSSWGDMKHDTAAYFSKGIDHEWVKSQSRYSSSPKKDQRWMVNGFRKFSWRISPPQTAP